MHWNSGVYKYISVYAKFSHFYTLILKIAKPNNNHTVPIVYLKQFINADWKFWVFDNKRIWRREELEYRWIWQLTVWYKFYVPQRATWEDEYAIETNIFANIVEDGVKEVLVKITKNEQIDIKDMFALWYFIAFQYYRTTKFKEHFIESSKELKENDIKRDYSDERYLENLFQRVEKKTWKRPSLDPKQIAEKIRTWKIVPNVTIWKSYYLKFMLSAIKKTFEVFMDMGWKLLLAPEWTCFITTDNPLVICPVWDQNIWIWICTKWAKKYISLSPKVCLELGDQWEWENIPSRYTKISKDRINTINYYIAINYDRHIICNDKDLLRNLIDEHKIKERKKEKSYIQRSEFNDHILLHFNVLPK